eukprot:635997-Hanusia_phi.AAC.1
MRGDRGGREGGREVEEKRRVWGFGAENRRKIADTARKRRDEGCGEGRGGREEKEKEKEEEEEEEEDRSRGPSICQKHSWRVQRSIEGKERRWIKGICKRRRRRRRRSEGGANSCSL